MRFHRFLRGASDLRPPEWVVSRICEEFTCVPSVAVKEWRRDPLLVSRIMEQRAYADAFQRFTTAKDDDALPNTGADPMMDLVWEITAELMKQR